MELLLSREEISILQCSNFYSKFLRWYLGRMSVDSNHGKLILNQRARQIPMIDCTR